MAAFLDDCKEFFTKHLFRRHFIPDSEHADEEPGDGANATPEDKVDPQGDILPAPSAGFVIADQRRRVVMFILLGLHKRSPHNRVRRPYNRENRSLLLGMH